MLASGLAGSSNGFVSSDVALDAGEPVVGSFTADGLTYSVGPDGLTLAAVDAAAAPDGSISVPASIAFNGTTYPVTAVGPYAFYLSGATSVELPSAIASVDERAFRSSDVERVEVDPANESFASYDGALYSADKSCLLLIPGGRQGAVRISSTAGEVDAWAFSHCAGVDAVSADAGSATFASWDGLLYDASGTTLLRVPAGATEITIRDGCTTIAAGAMEGCASLERIHAPASVASISPDVFTSIPTVSLPAASIAGNYNEAAGKAPQLTAMVALSTTDDDLPEVDPAAVAVSLPADADMMPWHSVGWSLSVAGEMGADIEGGEGFQSAESDMATTATYAVAPTAYGNGGLIGLLINGKDQGFRRASLPSTDNTWRTFWIAESRYLVNSKKSASGLYYYKYWAEKDGAEAIGWSLTPAGPLLSDGTYFTGTALYAIYGQHISFDPNGGSGGQTSMVVARPDEPMPAISAAKPTRNGYTFGGWYDTSAASGGTQYYTATGASARNWDKATNTTLYARWTPTISADTPLEVTVCVDMLGLEEQQAAQGYIESRCGEALKVAELEFTPLAAATELFGAANVGDVFLEVHAGTDASPNARFALDAPATQAPNAPASFRMASYGERVPVVYRFDIPRTLLPMLVEATKPVCSVAYAVMLAD